MYTCGSSLVPSPFLYPRERVWGIVHIQLVAVECMTCTKMYALQFMNVIFGHDVERMCMVAIRTYTYNYILCLLELSHAVYCNLIGVWKFLNGDTLDVHNSPDPLSLFLSRRGWCARLMWKVTYTIIITQLAIL